MMSPVKTNTYHIYILSYIPVWHMYAYEYVLIYGVHMGILVYI
jgi:hypothetical protein